MFFLKKASFLAIIPWKARAQKKHWNSHHMEKGKIGGGMIDLSGDEAINRRCNTKQFERINRIWWRLLSITWHVICMPKQKKKQRREVEKLIRFLCWQLNTCWLFYSWEVIIFFAFLATVWLNQWILTVNAKVNCLIFWLFLRYFIRENVNFRL